MKPQMRILHVVGGNDSRGGVMSYVRGLAAVSPEGIQNLIWKSSDYPAEDNHYVCLGRARIIDISISHDVMAAALDLAPLLRWAHSNKTGLIIYAHSRMGIIVGTIVAKSLGIPLIIHLHALAKRPFIYRAFWKLGNATVVYNSAKTKGHYGSPPEKSLILTPFIDWPNEPKSNSPAKFVACSSFLPWKNLHLIVAAFSLLQASPRKVSANQLYIYGMSPAPLDPKYQQTLQKKALTVPSVRLIEWQRHWSNQLSRNDIFVHAADNEPFGIVILEAFAAGLRMVVPPGTFLDDLPEPQRSEGIIRFADAATQKISAAMLEAEGLNIDVETLRRHRGIVAEQFSIGFNNKALVKLYGSLLTTL